MLKQEKENKNGFNSISNWWENLKMEIKQLTIKYCTNRVKEKSKMDKFYNKCLEETAKENKEMYTEIKKQISIMQKHKLEGIKIRGRGKDKIENENYLTS